VLAFVLLEFYEAFTFILEFFFRPAALVESFTCVLVVALLCPWAVDWCPDAATCAANWLLPGSSACDAC